MTRRKACWVRPNFRRWRIGKLRCLTGQIIDDVDASEELLLAGQIKIKFAYVRIQLYRRDRIETKASCVQEAAGRTITCSEVIHRILRGRCGESRYRCRVHADCRKGRVQLSR